MSQIRTNSIVPANGLAGDGGGVIQVVSTTKTDTYATTIGTTWTDITGISVSITPQSTSNKILVNTHVCGASADRLFIRLVRGGTVIAVGNAASNRIQCTTGSPYYDRGDGNEEMHSAFTHLDSPATTSATTYKVQARCTSGGGAAYINRCRADGDDAGNPRSASSITVMEISG